MKYDTEEELCAAFVESLEEWTAYPETCGWDLLLVNGDGMQVGLEAKKRGNMEVLYQAATRKRRTRRPDYVGVLVGSKPRCLVELATELGIGVVFPSSYRAGWAGWDAGYPSCPSGPALNWPSSTEPSYVPPTPPSRKRHVLPPVVPLVPAGVPSPKRLTKWRVGALRLCSVLRSRGYLTSEDFKAENISDSRWRQQWLRVDGRQGRLQRLVPRIGVDLPDVGWEETRDAIDEAEKAS